jgi:hypothetical protein
MKYSCAVLGIMAALSGCGSDPEPQNAVAATPPAQAAKPANVVDPTARMARAVGGGKPGAAVDLKYEFLSRPAVGKPVEVELALIPNAGVKSLAITVSGMEGVTLAGNLTADFTDVKAGQPYKHQFSLLADRAGVFYLTVAAITKIGGASMGRTFSVPFVVGTPVPKEKSAAPQKDATGQPIQPMAAQESTR